MLMLIHTHLLKYQYQTSTVRVHTSTLQVLVERQREFQQRMPTGYVDLKAAFDSVHGEALWDLLCLRRVPAGIVSLLSGLYCGTESALTCVGGGVFSFFLVHTGVRQGCILAPSLFNTCMDWVLGRAVDQRHCRASVSNTRLTDVVDDAVIFANHWRVW